MTVIDDAQLARVTGGAGMPAGPQQPDPGPGTGQPPGAGQGPGAAPAGGGVLAGLDQFLGFLQAPGFQQILGGIQQLIAQYAGGAQQGAPQQTEAA